MIQTLVYAAAQQSGATHVEKSKTHLSPFHSFILNNPGFNVSLLTFIAQTEHCWSVTQRFEAM